MNDKELMSLRIKESQEQIWQKPTLKIPNWKKVFRGELMDFTRSRWVNSYVHDYFQRKSMTWPEQSSKHPSIWLGMTQHRGWTVWCPNCCCSAFYFPGKFVLGQTAQVSRYQLSWSSLTHFSSFLSQNCKYFMLFSFFNVRICVFSFSFATVNEESFGFASCWLEKKCDHSSSLATFSGLFVTF